MKTLFQLTGKLTIAAILVWLSVLHVAAQNYCAKVDFAYDITGQEVKFTGTSPETVQEWYWYFGDNTSVAKGPSQTHVFQDQGSYDVCLKILVNDNCTGAVCKKIQIGPATNTGCDLKPDFQYSVSGGQVKFSGSSTAGDNGKYYWSFGNGKSGEGRETSSDYAADGYYEVCMKVLAPATTAAAACTDHICKKIQIGSGTNTGCDLKPDFQYTVSGGQVKFSGSSTAGDNGKYYWSFGNGKSGEGRETSSDYAADGYYEVCMKVLAPATTAAAACTDHICKKVQIGSGTGSGCDLKADFEYKKDGLSVYFGASSSDLNATYYWQVTGENAQYQGKDVKIAFAKAGYYEVCMTAVNGAVTCKVQVCKKVEVGNGCDLKVDFTYVASGQNYTFNASSNGGDQAKYYWSFGNGTSAEGKQASAVFSNPGSYEVCLKVLGGPVSSATAQCVDVVCKKIQTGPDNQECNLEADYKYTANGNEITFRASSNDDKAEYYWYGSDFPSAAGLTGREIVHRFDKDGVYEVCLVAVDGDHTCKVKVCKKVTVGDNIKVYPNPTTDFIHFASERVIIRAGIYDQMNKELLVSEVGKNDGRIDVSGLTQGLYMIRLVLEDQTVHAETFYKN